MLSHPRCVFAAEGIPAEETNGVSEAYRMGSELQKSGSLRKSNSVVMRKQTSKKEEDKHEAIKRQLIEEEERERGSVSFSVYWTYATSVYKGALVVIILLSQLSFMVRFSSVSLWKYCDPPSNRCDLGELSLEVIDLDDSIH